MTKPKVVTRVGVFETNSSSTHSCSVALNGVPDLSMSGKHIICQGGEFGWEQEIYHDFYTKLEYLITGIMGGYNNDNALNPNEYAQSKSNYKMLEAVLYSRNITIEVADADDAYSPFGYIDHSGEHGIEDDVFGSFDNVFNFLFLRESYVETDNDNH